MRSILPVLPLFVLLLAGTVVPVRAQTQAYDIATFSPPPGWKTFAITLTPQPGQVTGQITVVKLITMIQEN